MKTSIMLIRPDQVANLVKAAIRCTTEVVVTNVSGTSEAWTVDFDDNLLSEAELKELLDAATEGVDEEKGIPNIDDSPLEDLLMLQKAFGNLSRYAYLRREAASSRLSGDISKALRYEAQMQAIYNLLPQQFRW